MLQNTTRAAMMALVATVLAVTFVAGGGQPPATAGERKGEEAPSVEPTYPAQPKPGTLYWGAAVSGNGDPAARHEEPAGTTMAIRRTFFRWHHITSGWLEQIVRDDHRNGRLPWISVKTPQWRDVAEGKHDQQVDQLLKLLRDQEQPIWFTVWHEPENDADAEARDRAMGTPADHLAMNRRFRQRMDALEVDNVALVPILMAWTWDERAGREPEAWWNDEVYDFLGIDIYRDREATIMTDTWDDVRKWAAKRRVDVAVGEWGMRGQDQAAGERIRQWYEAAAESHKDADRARVVALCAFDSHLNSPTGSWELLAEQLRVFQQLMHDPRTARAIER